MHTTLSLLVASALGIGACSPHFGAYAPQAAGVTTGGAQDVGLARNQIAAGVIPSPDAFVVEGLLSEHDIDITAPPCDQRFCLHTAVDVAPALDTGDEALFMVAGMSSNIDLATFQREPLNLAVVVDRSGSMAGGKMAAARQAVHQLVDQLREGDRLALIAFDHSVHVLLSSTPVTDDKQRIHALVRGITDGGSTDIESALAEGFEQVFDHTDARRSDRVILLTDAQPNTGRTDDNSFLGLTRAFAERGVGLTVFGVGIDFGQRLTLEISRIPGGNYVYLEDEAKLARVFDDDFDLLVTPVAWDFEMRIEPLDGFAFTAAYGVPSWVRGEGDGAVTMHIPTLFLSRNRGAIVLRMEPVGDAAFAPGPVADSRVEWREERRGEAFEHAASVILPGDALEIAVDPGVQKAVVLVNTALALQRAATLAHAGLPREALAVLDEVDALVASQPYQRERGLVGSLRALIAPHVPAQPEPSSVSTEWSDEAPQNTPVSGEDRRWIR